MRGCYPYTFPHLYYFNVLLQHTEQTTAFNHRVVVILLHIVLCVYDIRVIQSASTTYVSYVTGIVIVTGVQSGIFMFVMMDFMV